MDDMSDVEQPKIFICVQGLGTPIEGPGGAHVPGPPEGCESRQILDHGSVTAILLAPHMDLHHKLRAVVAYGAIWGIEVERLNPAAYAIASAPQPQ